MTIKTDEQATTLAWHKGAFAGKNVWYDDDPYYIYYPADQYEDDLRNGVGSDVADLILNVKDALVKNGAWDITGAERTFYDQLEKVTTSGLVGWKPSIALTAVKLGTMNAKAATRIVASNAQRTAISFLLDLRGGARTAVASVA